MSIASDRIVIYGTVEPGVEMILARSIQKPKSDFDFEVRIIKIAVDKNGRYKTPPLDKGIYVLTPKKEGSVFDPPMAVFNLNSKVPPNGVSFRQIKVRQLKKPEGVGI